jgi:hypothetical protein
MQDLKDKPSIWLHAKFDKNSDINLDDTAPIVIPENPPLINPKPTFNFELTKYKRALSFTTLNYQHARNLLLSEEATNVKEGSIALASKTYL